MGKAEAMIATTTTSELVLKNRIERAASQLRSLADDIDANNGDVDASLVGLNLSAIADELEGLDRKPQVNLVTAQYYRKGKCEVCGKGAEREKTFSGTTLEECQAQADRWMETPIRHRKCEGL